MGRKLEENKEEQVVAQKEILGDVIVGVQGEHDQSQTHPLIVAGDQIPVDYLLWEILEGDPRGEISEEEASVGETLKGGSPRAIKDDARICIILDCCRFLKRVTFNPNFQERFPGWKPQPAQGCCQKCERFQAEDGHQGVELQRPDPRHQLVSRWRQSKR